MRDDVVSLVDAMTDTEVILLYHFLTEVLSTRAHEGFNEM